MGLRDPIKKIPHFSSTDIIFKYLYADHTSFRRFRQKAVAAFQRGTLQTVPPIASLSGRRQGIDGTACHTANQGIGTFLPRHHRHKRILKGYYHQPARRGRGRCHRTLPEGYLPRYLPRFRLSGESGGMRQE